jgi:hypothetical protein
VQNELENSKEDQTMKLIVRILVVVLALSFLFPMTLVNAQDGSSALPVIPTTSAVYYMTATSGSFADQGDGTYLLTLEGVGANVAWIMTSPSLMIQQHSVANLNMQWAAAEGLATDAVVNAAGLNVAMTLTSPTYDESTGMQTFAATVTGITAPAGVKEPDVPATFDAASLSIAWSDSFQGGLLGGISAMYEGLRATPEECATAQQEWNDYQTWLQQQLTLLNQVTNDCLFKKDQAACTQMNAITAAIKSRQAEATQYLTLLNTECQ